MAPLEIIEPMMDAEAVNREIVRKLDAGQVDEAMKLIADDAVLLVGASKDGSGIHIGKKQIRDWYQIYVAGHSTVRYSEIHAHGNRLAWFAEIATDDWRSHGLDWRPFVGVGVYQGGLMKFGLWVLADEVMSQPANPESVVRRILNLLQAGKVDEALSLVAEEAIVTLIPPPPGTNGVFVGKEQIRGWWQTWTGSHGTVETSDFRAYGPSVTWSARVTEDGFRGLGLSGLEADAVGIAQGDLLRAWTFVLTADALAQLEAARAGMA